MPAKVVHLHRKVRERILFGVDLVADAARVTLDPWGRNVMIEKAWGAPTVTMDGAAVVEEIAEDIAEKPEKKKGSAAAAAGEEGEEEY